MALEYVIFFDCPVKQHLGLKEFILRLKEMAVLEIALIEGRARGEDELDVLSRSVVRSDPDSGPSAQTHLPLLRIKQGVDELKTLESHCTQCPVNAGNRSFGCYGAVNYPISRRTEQWVIEHFMGDARPAPSSTQCRMEAAEVDGGRVDDHRAEAHGSSRDGECMFESDQPLERIFEADDCEPRTVTTSQIFEWIMDQDEWDRETMLALLIDLGAVDEQSSDFQYPLDRDEETSLLEFQRFLYALYLAYKNGTIVVSDG